MMRQGLRRCARQATGAVSASLPLQSRSAMRFGRITVSSQTITAQPLRKVANVLGSRMYSTEADAQQQEQQPTGSESPGLVTKFADLQDVGIDVNLVKAITEGMGYERMSEVQAKTINPALKGTDIVAQAKTGTGKTIAFLLPMLQRMLNEDPSLARGTNTSPRFEGGGKNSRNRGADIRGIVLSPTRELAEQIAQEAKRLVSKTGLRVQCAVGGMNKREMMMKTRREGCHLLVATPGRLNDLLRDPSSGIEAPNLAALVLDEADRMLDVGFERELHEILENLPKPEEKVRQTLLMSATIPDNVIRLARTMVRPQDFEFVQTIPENESLTHDHIPQHVVPVEGWGDAIPTLFQLLDREAAKAQSDPNTPPFKAIVYLNFTAMVELVGEINLQRKFGGLSHTPTFSIQSKLNQSGRNKSASLFRSQRSAVLISSDVTARGMDFPNVTHVIQVGAPRERETYIHRLGRTGRQNKAGEGFLILPSNGIRPARALLKGLPLKEDTTLVPGESDVNYQEQISEICKALPQDMIRSAYTAMLGNVVGDKDRYVEEVNQMVCDTFGQSKPPPVSRMLAQKLGLPARSLNIREASRFDRDSSSRFDNDRESSSDRGGFGGRSSRPRRSSDPFDQFKGQIRGM